MYDWLEEEKQMARMRKTAGRYIGNTGYGPDGRLQPNKPTHLYQGNSGPVLLHEGEDVYANGKQHTVIPASRSLAAGRTIPPTHDQKTLEQIDAKGMKSGGTDTLRPQRPSGAVMSQPAQLPAFANQPANRPSDPSGAVNMNAGENLYATTTQRTVAPASRSQAAGRTITPAHGQRTLEQAGGKLRRMATGGTDTLSNLVPESARQYIPESALNSTVTTQPAQEPVISNQPPAGYSTINNQFLNGTQQDQPHQQPVTNPDTTTLRSVVPAGSQQNIPAGALDNSLSNYTTPIEAPTPPTMTIDRPDAPVAAPHDAGPLPEDPTIPDATIVFPQIPTRQDPVTTAPPQAVSRPLDEQIILPSSYFPDQQQAGSTPQSSARAYSDTALQQMAAMAAGRTSAADVANRRQIDDLGAMQNTEQLMAAHQGAQAGLTPDQIRMQQAMLQSQQGSQMSGVVSSQAAARLAAQEGATRDLSSAATTQQNVDISQGHLDVAERNADISQGHLDIAERDADRRDREEQEGNTNEVISTLLETGGAENLAEAGRLFREAHPGVDIDFSRLVAGDYMGAADDIFSLIGNLPEGTDPAIIAQLTGIASGALAQGYTSLGVNLQTPEGQGLVSTVADEGSTPETNPEAWSRWNGIADTTIRSWVESPDGLGSALDFSESDVGHNILDAISLAESGDMDAANTAARNLGFDSVEALAGEYGQVMAAAYIQNTTGWLSDSQRVLLQKYGMYQREFDVRDAAGGVIDATEGQTTAADEAAATVAATRSVASGNFTRPENVSEQDWATSIAVALTDAQAVHGGSGLIVGNTPTRGAAEVYDMNPEQYTATPLTNGFQRRGDSNPRNHWLDPTTGLWAEQNLGNVITTTNDGRWVVGPVIDVTVEGRTRNDRGTKQYIQMINLDTGAVENWEGGALGNALPQW